jgi:branched-chain amino acid transport system substrate-binding protein
MAQYAYAKGWRSAALATDTVIVYFKDVVKAFKARFTQLGGKIVAEESYQSLGSTSQQPVITKLNNAKADVIVTATAGAFGALPQILAGLRSLDNTTPMLNSWAGDGTYWVTKDPTVTNYYFVTYASVFGDDPSAAVRQMIGSLKAAGAAPGTGGFLGGADAIDGVSIAIKRAHGSLKGSALAAQLVKFNHVAVLGGKISFSAKLHTVFGRQYRVMKIQNNKASYVGPVTAKVIPTLP